MSPKTPSHMFVLRSDASYSLPRIEMSCGRSEMDRTFLEANAVENPCFYKSNYKILVSILYIIYHITYGSCSLEELAEE